MREFFVVILFISLLGICYGAGTGIRVAVNGSIVDHFKQELQPMILKKFTTFRLNDIKASKGVISIHITNILFHANPIKDEQVQMKIANLSNVIDFNVKNLAGEGEFNGTWHILVASGTFYGNFNFTKTQEVNLKVAIVHNSTGNLATQVKDLNFSLTKEQVHVDLKGTIVADVLNYLNEVVREMFFEEITKTVKEAIPRAMAPVLDNFTARIPGEMELNDNFTLAMKLTENPRFADDFFLVDLEGCVLSKNNRTKPNYIPTPYPSYDQHAAKSMQIYISDYMFRSAVDAFFYSNVMKLDYSFTHSFIDLHLNCSLTTIPALRVAKDFTFFASPGCDILAKTKPIKLAFGISVNVTGEMAMTLKNQTLFFTIVKFAFEGIEIHNPNRHNLSWLDSIINPLLNQGIFWVNHYMKDSGIPLPHIKGMEYSDVEMSLDNHLKVLLVPIIHFSEQSVMQLDA